jgi:hypothetical protein
VKHAITHGWRAEPAGTKVKLFPADKNQSPVTIPTRAIGRGLKNVEAQLKQRGLPPLQELPGMTMTTITTKATPALKNADGPLTIDFSEKSLEEIAEIMADPAKVAEHVIQLKDAPLRMRRGAVVSQLKEFIDAHKEAVSELMDVVMAALDHDEPARPEPEEAKRLRELEAELKTERRASEKMARDLSRLGAELQEERTKHAEALERANHAENSLRAIKQRLEGI